MSTNGHESEDEDEEEIPHVEKYADITYREFVGTMNRLLEEGYSPFAVLIGLARCNWEAAETLDDELHK